VQHPNQAAFINSNIKRIIVRAGRRGGKTTGIATRIVKRFLQGRRQSYGTPTLEQVDKCWFELNRALEEPIKAGIFKRNETEHTIERPGTEQRIKLRTVWNADTMRGDYGDDIYFDEWQLMNEDAWDVVGAPMLLDNNGDAVFIYTPPSLRSAGVSKARDPRHAAKMFRKAQEDASGRWATFHFTSYDNPFISRDALNEISQDMSRQSYRQEILAEDDDMQLYLLVYGKFNEDTCRINRFPLPAQWPRYVGHDFGGANPAALFFAQDPATGYFYAYAEYLPGPGRSTAQHVERFKELTQGSNVVKRAGGSHQEEEIRQAYIAHGWPIQEPKLSKINAQVDRVIGMMELNKLFIFNDLSRYLEEVMGCLWDVDSEGHVTDKIAQEQKYHLCAAARYILSDFTPETVGSQGFAMVMSQSSMS